MKEESRASTVVALESFEEPNQKTYIQDSKSNVAKKHYYNIRKFVQDKSPVNAKQQSAGTVFNSIKSIKPPNLSQKLSKDLQAVTNSTHVKRIDTLKHATSLGSSKAIADHSNFHARNYQKFQEEASGSQSSNDLSLSDVLQV